MNSLFLNNFRCFKDPNVARLAPITLLTGENSTGKSSFLAAIRVAWDILFGEKPLNFNEMPFELGSYDQIAHYRAGKPGRAKSFCVGGTIPVSLPQELKNNFESDEQLTFHGYFIPGISEPIFSEFTLQFGKNTIRVHRKDEQSGSNVQIKNEDGTFSIDPLETEMKFFPGNIFNAPFFYIFMYLERLMHSKSLAQDFPPSINATIEILQHAYHEARNSTFGRPYAVAPVRTKPKRTYNPITDTPEPEGGHVPMVLAKMSLEGKSEWTRLQSSLHRFGQQSGLFNRLNVKRHGKKGADPFQITVQIVGPPANLIDVGYGVSQVLPVLVDTLRASSKKCILLQQPEVHLHPKAQAELGTFLVDTAHRRDHTYIIETHSDYLIDRIRMEYRERTRVDKNDLSILFFERIGIDVQIHSIDIDEFGNLVNPPESYRDFFINEDRRLFGLDE